MVKLVMRMPLLARGGRFGTNDDRRPVAHGQLDSHATRLVVPASVDTSTPTWQRTIRP